MNISIVQFIYFLTFSKRLQTNKKEAEAYRWINMLVKNNNDNNEEKRNAVKLTPFPLQITNVENKAR